MPEDPTCGLWLIVSTSGRRDQAGRLIDEHQGPCLERLGPPKGVVVQGARHGNDPDTNVRTDRPHRRSGEGGMIAGAVGDAPSRIAVNDDGLGNGDLLIRGIAAEAEGDRGEAAKQPTEGSLHFHS